MKHVSTKTWFSADELASMDLPGLPKSKRRVNIRIDEEKWALAVDGEGLPLARKREGRGGGMEYHLSLLPKSARVELVRRGVVMDAEFHQTPAASQKWRWFEQQSEKTREEAMRRLSIVDDVEALVAAGMGKGAAVAASARTHVVSEATIWNWLKLVEGIAPSDRLPCIAPQRRGGGSEAQIPADIWEIFLSDYLRAEKPTMTSVYDRTVRIAELQGITLPHVKTFKRKLEREIDKRVIIARRDGAEALRRSVPAQTRTVADLHAMELLNIDGHKFDVFVRWEDGRISRPMGVAIQDVFSRKMLAVRIGETENKDLTRLAFGDVFRDFGIPKACLMDNGRAFASKAITGGAKTRFRFKIKDEDPAGLLTSLGIAIHWATPYRGQSKPIERAFRDFCDRVAKHPKFHGAYTGNRPDAKPDNYGSSAVPIALFREVLAEELAMHNAREGRRTEMANGRSFDAVFNESYALNPIGKATPEQMRMALLAAEQVTVDRRTGEISLYKNRYWSPAMSQYHGRKVTVRFDPDDLHGNIHVYDLAGAYLTEAQLIEASGFTDTAAARDRQRFEGQLRKSVRESEANLRLLDARELASRQAKYSDENETPEPQVVRPIRARKTAAALKPVPVEVEQSRDTFADRFTAAASRLRLVED